MAEASNGRGIRIALPGLAAVVWGAVVIAFTVATHYVYVTKAELVDHAAAEAAAGADLRTKQAVTETHVGEHHRSIEKHDRVLGALDENIRTLMLEMSIPRSRIARPKE